MPTAKKATITNPNNVPTEVLADSIVTVSQGMKKLMGTRLTDRALFLLIQDSLGGRGKISLEQIGLVLRAARDLKLNALKPEKVTSK